jgi:energy-coupling factor transporter ATP-binding protein EcfA2
MESPAVAIRTQGLVVGYGATEVLHGLDLMLPAGQWCVLLGPNGSGKTTLMKTLLGLLVPTRGEAHVLGREMLSLSTWPIDRQGLALMKLFDGHILLMFATTLAIPGLLRGVTECESLSGALFLLACAAQYFGHILSAYFLAFGFMAVGASLYVRVWGASTPLTAFVPLWIGAGLVPIAPL